MLDVVHVFTHLDHLPCHVVLVVGIERSGKYIRGFAHTDHVLVGVIPFHVMVADLDIVVAVIDLRHVRPLLEVLVEPQLEQG